MPILDHHRIAELFRAEPGASGPPVAATRAPARADASAGGPAAGGHVEAYLAAHAEVLLHEAQFVEAAPWLRDELLAVDAAYQRARVDLVALKRRVPAQRSLTGPHTVLASVRALRELLAALAEEQDQRLSRRHGGGPLAPAREWIGRAALTEIEAAHANAVMARAHALGPAIERAALSLDAFVARAGALAAPAWTRAVVLVRCTGVGPGSGVLIAPDRVLTAAHVLVPSGPDVPAPSQVRVSTASGALLPVSRVRVHRTWLQDHDLAFDYAMLDVSGAAGAGLSLLRDFGVDGGEFPVQRFGHPTDGGPQRGEGTIDFAIDMYESADLRVPSGASGGAIVFGPDADPTLVGITTFSSSTAPGEPSPVGLPVRTGLEGDLVEG